MNAGRFDPVVRSFGGASRRRILRAGIDLAAAAIGARTLRTTAQDATPGAGADACPATTLDENKALVERYWAEVWTAGGEAALADIIAPDELHHWGVGGDTVGPDPFIQRLRTFFAAVPDFAVRVDQVIAEGDLVVSRYTATATQQGEWLGIAPSGVAVEYTGMNVFRIACGKIAESWGEADHLGLLRQLGGAPDVATPVSGTPSP